MNDKEAIEWIKVDLKSLKLVEPVEPKLIKQKENLIPALEKAVVALEQKEKLLKRANEEIERLGKLRVGKLGSTFDLKYKVWEEVLEELGGKP